MNNEINNNNKPGNSDMTDSDKLDLNADTLIGEGDAVDILAEKLTDAMVPGAIVEFDPEEAERAGAFVEDALSESDALESSVDSIDLDQATTMAKIPNPDQKDLFADWLVVADEPVLTNVSVQTKEKDVDNIIVPIDKSRHILALRLAEQLDKEGEITSKLLTEQANRAFGGTQAEGVYSSKDAYDAMEAAFNIHLFNTENADWTDQDAAWATNKAIDLTSRIQKLPTQTRRDENG